MSCLAEVGSLPSTSPPSERGPPLSGSFDTLTSVNPEVDGTEREPRKRKLLSTAPKLVS